MFKRVKEATYLTAEKAWSYRAILRYFYMQHERMREFLFPEEIYEYIKQFDEFRDYTIESLHLDLDALVKWGNLIARQELGKSKTVEEFKKKRFRYQCTPYTVEFERMLMELEGIGETFGGSLERTQFERLYQSLQKIEKIATNQVQESNQECTQVWEDALTYFRQITQNTSDYIAYINSEEVEERMQTEAFLIYKDQFTTYLRDFIIALQGTALQIQDLLLGVSQKELEGFFTKVIQHNEQVFRLEEKNEENPLNEYEEKWKSMEGWFLGNEHGESEYEMLQNRTNESIRRITRVVQRLGERHQHFRSRKKDYLHLAKWFDSIEEMEETHELSSVAFGVFHTRHFHIDHIPTDNIYADVWDEAPMEHETKPMIRNYRERTRPGAVTSNQKKKEETMRQYLEQKQHEKKLIEQYIEGNEIRVENLPTVETHVRKLLLSWIGKAMASKNQTIKTELGRRVHVVMSQERVTLQSKDGALEMPKVTFQFIDDRGHNHERTTKL
ncbi:TIGR02677 family protein [Ornithinibacillus halophilus]|uniref:TIGR02677 family protein n=1 Tax=Ornithinibacillus halophilus TaxID=930117 RepID=A0A1M5KEK5_9BACI|nr:TIGR02677 family protein [Ornithinibacillus halophilus]SHG51286.1 TIGR02677 family protein [Ornithinibacillus halophilus]